MNVINKVLIIGLISLSACKKPQLPDPTFRFPKPPEQLMVPPEKLKPIIQEEQPQI